MLYATQLFVELNLGWLPGCWTYYWRGQCIQFSL